MLDYELYKPQLPISFYKKLFDFDIGLSGQRILDINTGYGHIACELAKRNCLVTGIDDNVENIKMAKIIANWDMIDVSYMNCPIDNLPFSAHSFDIVIIPHDCSCKVKEKDFAELKRVLTSNGKLIISKISLKSKEIIKQKKIEFNGLLSKANYNYNENIEYSTTHWLKIKNELTSLNKYDKKFDNNKIIIPHNITTSIYEMA